MEVWGLDPKAQDKLLGAAIENGWTRKQLRAAVRDHKRSLRQPTSPESNAYRVLYADPPWKYSDELIEGYGAAEHHYPTLSIQELAEYTFVDGGTVADRVADNAVLFLWVTSPMLEDCFKVVTAWGFKYKASFVWDKVKHNYGHYNSVRHELLLVCTRGSCTPDPKAPLYDSVVEVGRTEHSKKPNVFRNMIDTMYPEGRRLELFGRRETEGWEVHGLEVAKA